ncbi:MAG: arsenosugar biosynthesis radical SAM (seleno)protein ArsS [Pirellulaceae bacterium]
MPQLTLLRQGNSLSHASEQLQMLQRPDGRRRFDQALDEHGITPLRAGGIEVLQVNLGKLCNQTCRHCHVDAGPDRREIMKRGTIVQCLKSLAEGGIPTLDITGGAPEMNPHFRWLVERARMIERRVIDRCNLTILLAPGYDDLPTFLAEHRVEVVASLPCYLEGNTDAQRGDGVFQRSIKALRRLNALGYGHLGSGLELTLMYNPSGPSLPPPQKSLEADYRRELAARYDVVFNRLYTITNMPISRFLDDLLRTGQYESYMRKLTDAFNPLTCGALMCRSMLSVDWQGRLYDCDFNQMLNLGLAPGMPRHIADFDFRTLAARKIVTGQHCFGCTAGSGSSCQGNLATQVD